MLCLKFSWISAIILHLIESITLPLRLIQRNSSQEESQEDSNISSLAEMKSMNAKN